MSTGDEADPPPLEQFALFDLAEFTSEEYWRTQWGGMPEFVQEDQTPYRSLLVHFETVYDLLAFARLIGQDVGPNVKSIWFPEAEITRYADKRYASR